MVLVADRAQSSGKNDRARAVLVRVVLHSVAHLQELPGVEIGAGLRRQKVVLERCGNRSAVKVRINTAGIDDVVRGPLSALAGDEEVRAILDDRAAERGAVLIATIGRLAASGDLLARRLRVEAFVAIELVGASFEVIRASLRDDSQHAAGRAAEFRFVLLRLNIEFLHCLDVVVLQRTADGVVGVVAAIDEEVDVAAAAAVERDGQLPRLGRVGIDRQRRAGCERAKVGELTAVERQILHLRLADDRAHRRRGLDERR